VGIGTEAVRRGRIDLGDDVVVIGVGLLGLIILQLAKISGAGRTIAVGRGHRLGVAGELGADEKVDRTQGNVVERVKELTNGEGADVVIECAGADEAVRQSLDCVRRGGRVVLAGVSGKKGVSLDTDRIVLDEIEVIGSREHRMPSLSPSSCWRPVELMSNRSLPTNSPYQKSRGGWRSSQNGWRM